MTFGCGFSGLVVELDVLVKFSLRNGPLLGGFLLALHVGSRSLNVKSVSFQPRSGNWGQLRRRWELDLNRLGLGGFCSCSLQLAAT